jgi:hypothetical protein
LIEHNRSMVLLSGWEMLGTKKLSVTAYRCGGALAENTELAGGLMEEGGRQKKAGLAVRL